MTQEGYYVVGKTAGGANTKITIPATIDSVSVGQNGAVTTVDRRRVDDRRARSRWRSSRTTRACSARPATASSPRPTPARRRSAPPATTGIGLITPGAIEMSNVDLAQEFTNMITAQRGFQANSRVISAADEMLQELVNLKR